VPTKPPLPPQPPSDLFRVVPPAAIPRLLNDPRSRPFRIADTTPPATRERWLNQMAEAGRRSTAVCEVAALLAQAVDAELAQPSVRSAYTRQELLAQRLLDFVQNQVGYVPDPPGEWYQGALYTLGWGGDCEDLSVLLVSLARCVGLKARVKWLDQPGYRLNHVSALMVIDGREQWAEASVSGARLGEHPWDAASRVKQTDRLGLDA
jgi:transglutaminase-like putative cysteine protease